MTLDYEEIEYPEPIGSYSVVKQSNNLLFISGQIGLVPRYNKLAADDFNIQAYQVFKNINNICLANKGNLKNILKLTIFLTNIKEDKSDLDRMIKQFFINPFPARTTVEVSQLPLDAKIEVDAVMEVIHHNDLYS